MKSPSAGPSATRFLWLVVAVVAFLVLVAGPLVQLVWTLFVEPAVAVLVRSLVSLVIGLVLGRWVVLGAPDRAIRTRRSL